MQTGPGDKPPPKSKPKPAPSQTKDTKGAADVNRGAATVRRNLQQIRTKQAQAKDTKGNADRLPEAQRQKVVDQATGIKTRVPLTKDPLRQTINTNVVAPGLKVLDQTTRPVHAVAGAADAAITGGDILKAAGRGIQNKDHTTFSDVLKHAGAPKWVQAVGGFGLDVVADPATYVTFGTSSIARNAAMKAGQSAYKGAIKQGLTEEQAQRFWQRAATQAAKQSEGAPKGLAVKVAGKHLPGVTKATAPLGKVGSKASGTKLGQAVRGAASDFNPNMAPAGATRAQADAATSAARTTRATTQRGVFEAKQKAVALRKSLGKDDPQVVNAIETGAINSLPQHLQLPAQTLAQHYGAIRKAEKAAGVRGGTRTNYVPHYTNESLQERAPSELTGGGSVGKGLIRPDSSKARKEGTLAEKTAAQPGMYNQDAALAYLNRTTEGVRSTGQATLNRRIATELGRPLSVLPGGAGHAVPDGSGADAVFHLKGSDLVAVTDRAELKRIAKTGHAGKGGQYVVLNKALVKKAHATSMPSGDRGNTGAIVDKGTGFFKFIATQPNPAFHVRNFVGDTHNAYTAQNGRRMAANMAQAGKTLRALKRDEEAMRTLGKTAKPVGRGVTGKTVKLGDGTRMTHADLAHEAAGVGAIRSGFLNQELPELLRAQGRGARSVGRSIPGASRVGRAVKRTVQSREDLPRLSTYIEGRKIGMGPEEAARFSMGPHFDYANLTDVERKIRRFIPFYTFSARNIPYQAKVLLTKPGKAAAFQKAREEAAKAAGLGAGWEQGQPNWDQRNMGFPVRIGGKVVTITTGDPITDLNEFPVGLLTGHPAQQADEWMQKVASLANPLFKDPVEYWANYSFFFRDNIRQSNAPLVAAPDFVGAWPKWAKDKAGVTQIVDKKTGQKVWAWDAKSNYIAHAVPGWPNTGLTLASSGTDRSGRGKAEKVAGVLGIKATPLDPVKTKINDLYTQLDGVHTELGALSQRGIMAGDPRRDRLNALTRDIERQIYQLKQKRGDKVLPSAGGPRKLPPLPSIDGGLGGGMGGGMGGGF